MNSGYCPDATLIAAYQNSLYVIGLLNDSDSAPIINTKKIELFNTTSISSVNFNSLDGKSLEVLS